MSFQASVDKEMFIQLEEKDAEIERLNAQRDKDYDIMRKTVSSLTEACKSKDKLITELAEALESCREFLGELQNDIWKSPGWANGARELLFKLPEIKREASKDE